MNRLIDIAKDKLGRMKSNQYPYPDDDIIVIPRGGNPGSGPGAAAGLLIAQPSIEAVNATSRPQRFLHNDGTITTQLIRSVYVADPRLARDNLRFSTGTKIYTLRSFLSANAIRAKHSMDDIDYCSTNNSTVCAVQSITAPVTFIAMGAHYFISATTSGTTTCPPARTRTSSPSRPPSTVKHHASPARRRRGNIPTRSKNLYDYIAKWINDRY